MAGEPSDDELRQWHRRFAIDANNRAWQLVEMRTIPAPADSGT